MTGGGRTSELDLKDARRWAGFARGASFFPSEIGGVSAITTEAITI